MRGEETTGRKEMILIFDEVSREVLRTDFRQNRGSIRRVVVVVIRRRPVVCIVIGYRSHGGGELYCFARCSLELAVRTEAAREVGQVISQSVGQRTERENTGKGREGRRTWKMM